MSFPTTQQAFGASFSLGLLASGPQENASYLAELSYVFKSHKKSKSVEGTSGYGAPLYGRVEYSASGSTVASAVSQATPTPALTPQNTSPGVRPKMEE